MATEQIILDIRAQVADAKKRISDLEKSTKQATTATTNLNKNFEKVGATAKKLAGIFLSMYAVKKIASFASEVLKLADIQEKAEAKLLTALKGREQIQQRLIRQAQQLQKITLFGDEQTIEAQAFLAAMGLTERAIRRLTPLVQDLATKMNSDLVSAADLIAKSVGSSTNALSRYGITIEGAVGSSDRLESAIEGLNKQVGGQAEAAAKVGIGAIQQFQNALGDLKEDIGKEHIPFLTALFKALSGQIGQPLTDFEKFMDLLGNMTKEELQKQLDSYENYWAIQNERFQDAYKNGTEEAQDFYSDLLNQAEAYIDAIKKEIESREEDLTIIPELDDRQKALLKKQQDEYEKGIETRIKSNDKFLLDVEETNAEIVKSDKDLSKERKKEAEALSDLLLEEEKERAAKEKEIERLKNLANLESAAYTLGMLSSMAKEGSETQKALAIADATISTYLSAQYAFESLAKIPVVGTILGIAAAAAAVVFGLQNVAKIAGVGFEEGGYTGPGYNFRDAKGRRIAGVVHEEEFVFNREKTKELRPLFEDIHSGRIDARGLAALTKRGVILPMVKNEFHSQILEREVGRIYQKMQEEKPQRYTEKHGNGLKRVIGNTTYMINQ